jgi:large subunit ribosomal protein L7/L12
MDKDQILEAIDSMSVMELHELVEALKEKYNVTAAAPMMAMAGAPAAGGDGDGAPEKSTYDVIINEAGQQKIQVIKALKEAIGVGLKEAKELVDAAPKAVKEDCDEEEANKIKEALEGVGATVELK